MFSDLVSGTGSVSLSASLSTALDAATILKALDRYPHGCSEQITNRAMPLLYRSTISRPARIWRWTRPSTSASRTPSIGCWRVRARTARSGCGRGGDDAWLDAYVTDFLTRAREKGFAVPEVLFKNALDRIRNSVVNASRRKGRRPGLGCGLCVLARNGAAPIGDLRYLADLPSSAISPTPLQNRNWQQRWRWSATRRGRAGLCRGAGPRPKPVIEFGRVDYARPCATPPLVSLAGEGNAPRAT